MSLSEFDLIARYFAGHDRQPGVLLGVGDDAAILEAPAGRRLVVAIDTIVSGMHFLADAAPADIGYRALAVNLSDLAAMGAEPAWMTLSLSMPQADERWLAEFAEGLLGLAALHRVALVGGDTVRGPLVITVQVAGSVESDRWLARSGAAPGDKIFVSGVPGEAAGGLAVARGQVGQSEATRHLLARFLRPQPRIALGRRLRTLASAAMDVSDGLIVDLEKLCKASGCGACIDVDALPRSEAMHAVFDAETCIDHALAGGDDYELLFTVPANLAAGFARESGGEPLLTEIGTVVAGAGVQCTRAGRPFIPRRRGHDHFA